MRDDAPRAGLGRRRAHVVRSVWDLREWRLELGGLRADEFIRDELGEPLRSTHGATVHAWQYGGRCARGSAPASVAAAHHMQLAVPHEHGVGRRHREHRCEHLRACYLMQLAAAHRIRRRLRAA